MHDTIDILGSLPQELDICNLLGLWAIFREVECNQYCQFVQFD